MIDGQFPVFSVLDLSNFIIEFQQSFPLHTSPMFFSGCPHRHLPTTSISLIPLVYCICVHSLLLHHFIHTIFVYVTLSSHLFPGDRILLPFPHIILSSYPPTWSLSYTSLICCLPYMSLLLYHPLLWLSNWEKFDLGMIFMTIGQPCSSLELII